jgi:hypothetical protein
MRAVPLASHTHAACRTLLSIALCLQLSRCYTTSDAAAPAQPGTRYRGQGRRTKEGMCAAARQAATDVSARMAGQPCATPGEDPPGGLPNQAM